MPSVSDKLGIALFKAGFDIWLSGNRGTIYQRKHENADITEEEFWDYSTNNMAAEDIPAELEYILETTGKESMSYIGSSMGTQQFIHTFGMSQYDDDLLETVNKVSSTHLITPCYYVNFLKGEKEDKQSTASDLFSFIEQSDGLYVGGEGADPTVRQ